MLCFCVVADIYQYQASGFSDLTDVLLKSRWSWVFAFNIVLLNNNCSVYCMFVLLTCFFDRSWVAHRWERPAVRSWNQHRMRQMKLARASAHSLHYRGWLQWLLQHGVEIPPEASTSGGVWVVSGSADKSCGGAIDFPASPPPSFWSTPLISLFNEASVSGASLARACNWFPAPQWQTLRVCVQCNYCVCVC